MQHSPDDRPEPAPLLRVSALHKRHGQHEVLRGIDLDLHRGEIVAIVGASGAGKSTLLRCLAGLEPHHGGTLTLHGRPLQSRQVGWVFQGLNLPPQTRVGSHLMQAHACFGQPCAAGHARELLARVGLADAFDTLPAVLSPGQQQRVVIARALAGEPALLLCDDIASSAQPDVAAEVALALRALALEGQAVLVATHDTAFAHATAHRVLRLQDGRLSTAPPPSCRRSAWPATPAR